MALPAAARRTGRQSALQIQARIRRNLARAAGGGGARPVDLGAECRGRLVGGAAGARHTAAKSRWCWSCSPRITCSSTPAIFFDFEREAFLVVSLLVEPDAFDRGTERVLARASRAGAETVKASTPQRRPRPAVLADVDAAAGASASFADLPLFARWLAVGGPVIRPDSADHRDSRARDLAVLGADRHGARPDLHRAAGRRGLRQALGGEARLAADDRATLDRRPPVVARATISRVRPLKSRWLRRAFERFSRAELKAGNARAQRFATFSRERGMVARRLRAVSGAPQAPSPAGRGGIGPSRWRSADRDALAHALRTSCALEIDYRKYVQWIAAEQWAAARDSGEAAAGVRRCAVHDLRRTARTCGRIRTSFGSTPPWACRPMPSATPARTGACRRGAGTSWRRTISSGCDAARGAPRSLFDGFRLDHLVGLYRTYIRPRDPDRQAVLRAGRRARAARSSASASSRSIRHSGAEVIAEDLGTVPDFVRHSLQRLGCRASRCLRWERAVGRARPAVHRSADYPETSVATTGTHDTEPLASWWERAVVRGSRSAVPRCSRPPAVNTTVLARSHSGRSTTRCCARCSTPVAADHHSCAGHLRLARSHQHAGASRRRQLDVASAVAASIDWPRMPEARATARTRSRHGRGSEPQHGAK